MMVKNETVWIKEAATKWHSTPNADEVWQLVLAEHLDASARSINNLALEVECTGFSSPPQYR